MRIALANLLFIMALCVFSGGAHALSLESTSGSWQNMVGGENVNTFEHFHVLGNQQESLIRWGQGAYMPYMQSGLGFAGTAPGEVEYGSIFKLGTLRYANMATVAGNPATSVQLALDLLVDQQVYSYLMDFGINETLNVSGGGSANNDVLSFTSITGSDPFGLGLDIVGFGFSPDDLQMEFSAPEHWVSFTNLYARFRPGSQENPQPTPEPATMVLASLGLGAMAWRRRRKG